LQKDTPAFPDFYALLLSEFIFSGSTSYDPDAGEWTQIVTLIDGGNDYTQRVMQEYQ
jgi:hypothetical protein